MCAHQASRQLLRLFARERVVVLPSRTVPEKTHVSSIDVRKYPGRKTSPLIAVRVHLGISDLGHHRAASRLRLRGCHDTFERCRCVQCERWVVDVWWKP